MARLVFDASAVVSIMNSQDAHHDWALGVFIENADSNLYLSALTYAEVLVHPAKKNQVKTFAKNLNSAGFEIVPLEDKDAELVAEIRSETGLKMPDAIVLALAKQFRGTLVCADKAVISKARELKIPCLTPGKVL